MVSIGKIIAGPHKELSIAVKVCKSELAPHKAVNSLFRVDIEAEGGNGMEDNETLN